MQNIFSFGTFKPTEAERKAILDEIAILEEHKRRVFESIQRVETRIPKLKQEGVELEKEKIKKLARISAIRWIPFEVLGYIFEQCFEDGSMTSHSTYLNPDHWNNSSSPTPATPYTLSHTTLIRLQLVSKAWYYVVKSSPQLWTRLDLVGPFHLDNIHIHRGQIDSHALHSGRLPLQVTFWIGVDSIAPGPAGCRISKNWSLEDACKRIDALNRLLGYLILRTSDRWTSFDLRCIQTSWHKPLELRSVYPYIFSRATRLRHLVLRENSTINQYPSHLTPTDEQVNREEFLSLLCFYYGKNKAATLETMDLFDIPFVLQSDLFPLDSVRELNIGFTHDLHWGSFIEGDLERSWLSLFPRLRKLTLSSTSSTSSCFLRFRGQMTPCEEILGLIRTEEYEAKQLEELCIQGYPPLLVLHNVTLPLLKTMRIEANRKGAHLLRYQRPREWGTVRSAFGAVRTLYLVCSCFNLHPCTWTRPCSCPPLRHWRFWDTQPKSYPYDEELWHEHQTSIRRAFAPFLNLETVWAPSCVYRRLIEVFGSTDMHISTGMEDDQSVGYDQLYGKYEIGKDETSVRHTGLLALSGNYLRQVLKEQVEEEQYHEAHRNLDLYNPYTSYHSRPEHQGYEGA